MSSAFEVGTRSWTARRRLGAGVTVFSLCLAALLSPAIASAEPLGVTPRAATATVSVSAATVTVGAKATFTATFSADVTGAVATLQRQVRGGGFMDTAAPKTVSGSKLTVAVPTDWYGTRVYRMHVVLPDTTTVDTGTASVKVVPSYSPRGSGSAWVPVNGGISRWNPCGPRITYRVNIKKAYRGAVTDVKGAFSRIHKATGLRFTYLGLTSRLPKQSGTDQGDADIIVTWVTTTQLPRIQGLAGQASPHSVSGFVEADGKPVWAIQSGVVWINAKFNTLIPNGFGSGTKYGWGGTKGQLLMHELGHVMGLGHVADWWQIMHTPMTRHEAVYGAGDLRGLNRLGANQGCLVPQQYRPIGSSTSSLLVP